MKLWQKFRMQEYFKNKNGKVAFFKHIFNTKKIPEQFKGWKEFKDWWPPYSSKADLLTPETWKKGKMQELDGNSTSQTQ